MSPPPDNPLNDSVTKLQTVHEAALGDRLEQLSGAKWAGLAFRVGAAQRAVAVAGVRGDYTHQVHFFLTGEAVRQEYARVGDAQYTPLLFALPLFSDRFRSVVQKWFQPSGRQRPQIKAPAVGSS